MAVTIANDGYRPKIKHPKASANLTKTSELIDGGTPEAVPAMILDTPDRTGIFSNSEIGKKAN